MMRSLQMLSLAGAASAGYVSVPFSRVKLSNLARIGASIPGLGKRDTIDLAAMNNVTSGGYYGEFEVGTPGQKMTFILDTGSSDTWVNSNTVPYCRSAYQQSSLGYCSATFDPDESSTFESVLRNGFEIGYLDGTSVAGDYFNDTITIDGVSIENQQLGLATDSTETTGIMGLGFSANVAARTRYPTVVDNMVSQGVIDSAAYSLYLNDIDMDAGTILFGGIDTNKFIGELKTIPLIPDLLVGGDEITHFNVALDGFKMTGADDVDVPTFSGEAVLDSGSTISLLPPQVVDPIHEFFNVSFIEGSFAPFIDCKYRGSDYEDLAFEFDFDGKTIRNSLYEAIVNPFTPAEQRQILNEDYYGGAFDGWEGVCMFGLGTTESFTIDQDDFVLLGATFLRSAYVVYDMANEQLALAQANLNSTETNIVEIKQGDLPTVSGVNAEDANDLSDNRDPNAISGGGNGDGNDSGNGNGGNGGNSGNNNGSDDDDNNNDDDDDSAAGLLAPSRQVAVTIAFFLGAVYAL